MSIRIPVAMAASVVALSYSAASFADDTTTTTTSTDATTTAQPTTTTTAQPPVQHVTVQPPAQQPVATTQTTAAPYTADTYAEKTVEKRPNSALLSTGVGMFVISYGASAVAGAISDRDADKNLFIPVVGPWLDLGERGCDVRGCGNREDINKAMIVTSGIVQGAGVLLALSSLIIPESQSVSERRTTAKVLKPAKPEVKFSPVGFAAGAGFGAMGRF
jgi:hypothetical protein